ncbi:SAVED domain-containing protein [Nocardia sp. NPDC052112]|uniref:SAVED domain-containing protein n=1 Tax=Nocardia sp. NPDC052112 TaxID=3155646 RepID=UPI003447B5BE
MTVSVAELAHNVGATDTPGSPRGRSEIPVTERNHPDNLLLLCHGCHRKIDNADLRDLYTVDVLREIKSRHEDMVMAATDFATQHRSLIVTTRASVRGTTTKASNRQIAQALIEARRAPYSVDGRQIRVEIDLTDSESEPWVWERGCQRIDEAVARLEADTCGGAVDHVSVFALAPIPLLTYLGHRLDDKYGVEVHRRDRVDSDTAWCWPRNENADINFTTSLDDTESDAREAVVLVSVSGTVTRDRIPEGLAQLPVLELRPDGVLPGLDAIGSRTDLQRFSVAWRQLLALVEQRLPQARTLHVLAAVPAPAAVNMGRYRPRIVSPALVMYQRTDADTFEAAVKITE